MIQEDAFIRVSFAGFAQRGCGFGCQSVQSTGDIRESYAFPGITEWSSYVGISIYLSAGDSLCTV